MDDISRDALIEAVQEVMQETPPGDVRGGLSLVFPILSEVPAADVREVKRGEWRNNKNDYPECTECGYMPMYDPNMDDIYYSSYCPNCGAEMGGRDNGN